MMLLQIRGEKLLTTFGSWNGEMCQHRTWQQSLARDLLDQHVNGLLSHLDGPQQNVASEQHR